MVSPGPYAAPDSSTCPPEPIGLQRVPRSEQPTLWLPQLCMQTSPDLAPGGRGMFLLGSLGLEDHCRTFIPSLGSSSPKEALFFPYISKSLAVVSNELCPMQKSKMYCVQKSCSTECPCTAQVQQNLSSQGRKSLLSPLPHYADCFVGNESTYLFTLKPLFIVGT